MLETCRFHDKSLVMVTPKYLTESDRSGVYKNRKTRLGPHTRDNKKCILLVVELYLRLHVVQY